VFQKPGMGALHVSRVKIKNGAHGADKFYIQFVLVLMDPLFLLGRRPPISCKAAPPFSANQSRLQTPGLCG
jgi:hypothetical protein